MSEAMALRPRTLDEAMKLAECMAKSDIIPNEYRNKPGNIVIAAMLGSELGLGVVQAMQGICVINGKPTVYGDLFMAIIQGSGLLEEFSETWDEATQTATCRGRRRGWKDEIVRTFSMADANRIEVWEKDRDGSSKRIKLSQKRGPWTDGYARRMCQMRARGFFGRDGFSDALKGLALREEVEDYETVTSQADGGEIQMPKRLSAAPAPEAPKPNGAAEKPATPVVPPPVAHAEPSSAPTAQYASQREIGRLRATMRGTGKTESDLIDFLGRAGVTSPDEIPRDVFEHAVAWAKAI